MSNSRENVITRRLRGKFGDQVVFRTRNGKSFTANIPGKFKGTPGSAQVAARDRFRLASLWARAILANPEMAALYAARATNGRTPYVTALTDFLRPPRIAEIDCSGYHGHAGDEIRVSAFDDFRVKEVRVAILAADGTVLEEGTCVPDEFGMLWLYKATTDVLTLDGVTAHAIATDHPGHQGAGSVAAG